MVIKITQSGRRLTSIILLTLLPWPAAWLGMYRLHSLIWTFALYHGICLLPAVVWGRRLWQVGMRRPTQRELVQLLLAAVVVAPTAVWVYLKVGHVFIDQRTLLINLIRRGFITSNLAPLGLYFVVVNSVLEELFWRGVVFNELTAVERSQSLVGRGAIWTAATFAGWHYLVVRLLVRPGWAELAVAGIMLAGILFSRIYRRTGSIIVTILWHGLVFDLPLIVVLASIVKY